MNSFKRVSLEFFAVYYTVASTFKLIYLLPASLRTSRDVEGLLHIPYKAPIQGTLTTLLSKTLSSLIYK